MKNKLILIVVMFGFAFQSNSIVCSEKRTLWDRLVSFVFLNEEPETTRKAMFDKNVTKESLWNQAAMKIEKYKELGKAGVAAGTIAGVGGALFSPLSEAQWSMPANIFANFVAFSFVGVILAVNLHKIVQLFKYGMTTRVEAAMSAKYYLDDFFIKNNEFYPTRSSKINALVKKDEFVDYVYDEHGILQEACEKVLDTLAADNRTEEQRNNESEIDTMISTIKGKVSTEYTLESKLAALDRLKFGELSGNLMKAFNSVKFRLQNQLEVEKQLSPEEKAARQAWGIAAKTSLEKNPKPIQKLEMPLYAAEDYRLERFKRGLVGKSETEKQEALEKRRIGLEKANTESDVLRRAKEEKEEAKKLLLDY